MTANELIEAVRAGTLDKFEISALFWNDYEQKLAQLRADLCEIMINRLDISSIDNTDLYVVCSQFMPILLQAIAKDTDLKTTFFNYEYPDGIPNLTKDRTKEFEIHETHIRHTGYDENIPFDWKIEQNGSNFKLTNRSILIDNETLLFMD